MLYFRITRAAMYIASLRKVGGSVMLSVPPAILDLLHLKVGETVALVVDGERMVLEKTSKPSYTLDDLLAKCDASAAYSVEDREWLDDLPTGLELL
jgi:antitoxin ChpS